MKIQIETSKSVCDPPAEALPAVECEADMDKVHVTLHRAVCRDCGSWHTSKESCSKIFKVMNWLSPLGYDHVTIFYIRIHQLCFINFGIFLPLMLMMQILYVLFVYPSFVSFGGNSTLLVGAGASSSFVFARPNRVYVGYVEMKTCGGENQTIQVESLKWNPPAVSFDSPVLLNMSAQVRDVIQAPVEVSVDVSRFVIFTWVSMPCIDGLGSCTYKDVCALSPAGVLPCPNLPANFNIPCQCPVEPGNYFIKNGKLELPGSGHIPEWVTTGWFKAAIKVRDPVHNKQLACYEAKILIR